MLVLCAESSTVGVAQTERDWCNKIGFISTNLRGIRDGSRSFTIEQLVKAAMLHNVSLDWVCGITNTRAPTTENLSGLKLIEEGLRILKEG